MRKCLSYFMGVDRTIEGWEGLIAAQECLPTNKEKDQFGADYRVLNKAWNALSPDPILNTYSFDYQWLSRVYESVKPTDGRGGLIWAALGAKTMELVHQNLEVGDVHEDEEIITLIDTIEYDYSDFHLSMDCFWCEIVRGNLVLKEHENAKWLTKEQLQDVEWLPADIKLIESIRDNM